MFVSRGTRGVPWRSPARRRSVVHLLTALLAVAVWVATAPSVQADEHRPGHRHPTTVSFTFSGSYNGQQVAADILAKHGLAGTFYVHSGYIDYPAYLSSDQLRSITRAGSEIGGAGVRNRDLTQLSDADARRDLCDDRATLDHLGFPVTSLAYPLGSASYALQLAAHDCGYNSARGVAGLHSSNTSCVACPRSENLPPGNVYDIRTTSPGASVRQLEGTIEAAQKHGGGWVVLDFQYVCVCPERGRAAITPAMFKTLVTWVARQPRVTVRTVDRVIGGSLEPPVGSPLARFAPTPAAHTPSLPRSLRPAWTIVGVEIGQQQILFTALFLAGSIVITYRVATRSHRYGK
jgi:peptidoglycan/xylan/chitin deacetylase (PgdA/CDA1 family)